MSEARPQSGWVPLFWPSAWKDPKSLDWITGTPINCLVFESALPDMDPVRAEALRRKLAVVDWTKPESSGIVAGEAAKISWNGPEPVAAITDAVWPGIQASSTRRRDAVDAGPTGAPWIDANGWLAQLAHARAPGKSIWLVSRPPAGRQNVVGESAYQLAIADAAAGGARWLVSLDEQLAQDLAARSEAAMGSWRKLVATLRFFEDRPSPAAGQSRAATAILSTFSGDNEFLATEVLNLAARRHLLCNVLLAGQALAADLKPLKAILAVDEEAPAEALGGKLKAFVEAGGVLVAPAWAAKLAPGGQRLTTPIPGYDVRQAGRGRIAVPTAPWSDPYQVAADAQILISHREDPLVLFNGGSLMVWYAALPGGTEDLVELVRYTAESRGQPISLRLRGACTSVKLTTLEAPAAVEIRPVRVKDGVELALPRFGVFAALELRS
jgi:hypothetical protein